MDAITVKIRGKYVIPDTKEIMIGSTADVSKLPTTTTYGTFTSPNANEPVGVGSIAYTPDMGSVYQLGVDNTWHEVQSGGGGGGGFVVIDDTLSTDSTNPVQNKVITGRINQIQSDLDTAEGEIDTLQTDVSGAKSSIQTLQQDLDTAEGEIDTLQGGLSSLDSEVEGINSRVTALEGVLPEISEADAGKMLRVSSSGTWELVSITTIGDIT